MISAASVIEASLRLLGEINPVATDGDELNGSLPVEELLRGLLPVAASEALTLLPDRYLTYKEMGGKLTVLQNGTGWMTIPDDWTERIRFRLKGWARTVYKAILEDDPAYRMQENVVLRGSLWRPVCAVVRGPSSEAGSAEPDDEGRSYGEGFRLEWWSVPPTMTRAVEVVEARYVPRPDTNADGTEEYDMDEKALPVLTYLLCKHAEESLGEMQTAQYFAAQAAQQLQYM